MGRAGWARLSAPRPEGHGVIFMQGGSQRWETPGSLTPAVSATDLGGPETRYPANVQGVPLPVPAREAPGAGDPPRHGQGGGPPGRPRVRGSHGPPLHPSASPPPPS